MKEPVWVLPDAAIAIHHILIGEHGGTPGIRDRGLLDSALNRAPQRYAYRADTTIFELAASYAYGLVKNHPFVDGNKRVALTVAGMFLELNGYSLNAPESETVVVIEQLAASEFEEQAFSAWLETSSLANG